MSAFVTVPEFPNVPALPGVPSLLRTLTGVSGSLPILEASGILSSLGISFGTQWGIFDSSNKLVVEATSCVSFDFRGEYSISDYPVEKGGFQSYNKVIRPFDVRVTLTNDQSLYNRTAFIESLEAARATLDLYQVVTPEYAYTSVNIVHVDYSRSARSGATMIIADVWLRQVIETASATLSNANSSSGAGTVNGGVVQAATPTPAQSHSLGARIDSLFGGSLFKGLGLA